MYILCILYIYMYYLVAPVTSVYGSHRMEEQVASEETADKVDGAQVQKEERVRLHHGTDLGGPAEPGQAPEDLPAPAGSNPEEGFVILDQNGQPLHCERMVIVTGQSENGELYVIPSNHVAASQVLLPHGQLLDISETGGAAVPCSEKADQEALQTVSSDGLSNGSAACKLKGACGSFVVPLKPLPPNAPSWALRLRDCEKIGDSYRGYCSTEAELEAVLLLPAASDPRRLRHEAVALAGPQKPATRLMWKSQYVPYDGIPFVNAGTPPRNTLSGAPSERLTLTLCSGSRAIDGVSVRPAQERSSAQEDV
uniref:Uncharacterized protein n=1 Tax=Denticeps clupeoides TaxID=299321 RepID=A0AAY4B964_9TELE